MKTRFETLMIAGYQFMLEIVHHPTVKGWYTCKIFSGGKIWTTFDGVDDKPITNAKDCIQWTFKR